ncbi:MAG: hypothetical protein HYR83_03395 [Planctomycetes bacterium]|nr:hypothetical protein [Planctomycetota bacterium]
MQFNVSPTQALEHAAVAPFPCSSLLQMFAPGVAGPQLCPLAVLLPAAKMPADIIHNDRIIAARYRRDVYAKSFHLPKKNPVLRIAIPSPELNSPPTPMIATTLSC